MNADRRNPRWYRIGAAAERVGSVGCLLLFVGALILAAYALVAHR